MFGKEYATHLDILMQSFGEINEQYKKKIKKDNPLIRQLKQIYILIFGIPEIGFQIRSAYFIKIMTSYLSNKNFKEILDAGSGIGIYTLWLGKTFKNTKVRGVDIDRNKLKSSEIISSELGVNNVEFLYSNITKPFENSSYDLIVSIDVLEHVNRYEIALQNFYKSLKKGGYLYIHVPQLNQKRIFSSFKTWYHEGHVRGGITKTELENSLRKLGFKIIISKETFGFFGKLAWELNHLMLSRSFVLAGIIFPFLYALALIDLLWKNKNGLGIAILAQKK